MGGFGGVSAKRLKSSLAMMGFPATTLSFPSDFSMAMATRLVSAASLMVAGTLSLLISMMGLRSSGTPAAWAMPLVMRVMAGENFSAHLWGHSANGKLQVRVVGNDVVLSSGMKGADGDDDVIEGIGFAADDGLQHHDNFRSDDDGIFGGLRCGTVAAVAADGDVDGIRAGENGAVDVSDFAGQNPGRVVQRQNIIGLGKFGEEAGVKHGRGPANGFFGGLADEDDGAAPLGFGFGEHFAGAEENGHVQVVAASVHHADLAAIGALDLHFAGIRQARVFRDGKRVHVGANVNRGTGAIFQNRDDAVGLSVRRIVLAEMVGNFVAKLFELRGDKR